MFLGKKDAIIFIDRFIEDLRRAGLSSASERLTFSDEQIEILERKIGKSFPASTRSALQEFSLDFLELGTTEFGDGLKFYDFLLRSLEYGTKYMKIASGEMGGHFYFAG